MEGLPVAFSWADQASFPNEYIFAALMESNYFSKRYDLICCWAWADALGRRDLPISSRTQVRVLSPFFSLRKESESGCCLLPSLLPSLTLPWPRLIYSSLSLPAKTMQSTPPDSLFLFALLRAFCLIQLRLFDPTIRLLIYPKTRKYFQRF